MLNVESTHPKQCLLSNDKRELLDFGGFSRHSLQSHSSDGVSASESATETATETETETEAETSSWHNMAASHTELLSTHYVHW